MPLRTSDLARLRDMCRNGEARTVRLSAGVSLSELAHDIDDGLPPTTVHRWETGQRMPRGDHAMRYLRVLRSLQAAMTDREAAK